MVNKKHTVKKRMNFKVRKNSWQTKVIAYVWDKTPEDYSNYCPFFWATISAILFAPVVFVKNLFPQRDRNSNARSYWTAKAITPLMETKEGRQIAYWVYRRDLYSKGQEAMLELMEPWHAQILEDLEHPSGSEVTIHKAIYDAMSHWDTPNGADELDKKLRTREFITYLAASLTGLAILISFVNVLDGGHWFIGPAIVGGVTALVFGAFGFSIYVLPMLVRYGKAFYAKTCPGIDWTE